MKKLSLLVALFMCLTIGGVYATWSYAGTNDIADSFAEAKVTIADTELTGANGTYKIESNLALVIDQANEKHEAKLVFESNDGKPIHLTVTFTPATNAPQDVKKGAVPSEIYFGVTTAMQYKIDAAGNYDKDGTPTDIFAFTNSGNGKLDNTFTWVPGELVEGSTEFYKTFTYTLNADQLQEQIKLSQTFVLDTKAEHDAFRECLVGNIVARVTDGTVNS